MTYEKIFSEVQKNFKKAKTTDFTEDFAFQFNITGEGEGIFYAAFKDGVLAVEPYDYKDRDVIFEADGKTLIAISAGKMEPIDAIKSGKLSIDGNHELAKQLIFLINNEKASAPKAAAPKKAAEKKPAEPAKSPAKAETKPAVKTEAKLQAAPEAKHSEKAEKPAEKAAAKPVEKTEAKHVEKPAAKPAEKPATAPHAKKAKKK